MVSTLKRSMATLIAVTALVLSVTTALPAAPASASAAPPVTITKVDQLTAPVGVSNDTYVTITGAGFVNASVAGVYIAGESELFNVGDDNRIFFTTGGTLSAGVYPLTVQTANDGTLTAAPQFTYYDGPTISAVSPRTASTSGGTKVTVTGTDFNFIDEPDGGVSLLGGTNAITDYKVDSNTQLEFTAPPEPAGLYDVTVEYNGSYTSPRTVADYLTYTDGPPVTTTTTTMPTTTTTVPSTTTTTAPPLSPLAAVTNVSPDFGPAVGGTNIDITGTHFTGATDVVLSPGYTYNGGGLHLVNLHVISDSEITGTTPAGPANLKAKIQVITPAGTPAETTLNGASNAIFTYAIAPGITSVSPNGGPVAGGTSVAIKGYALSDGYSNGTPVVNFGTKPATIVSDDGQTLVVTTPPAITAGPVDITVIDDGGTLVDSGAFTYTAPAPTLTSVSQRLIPTSGGTTVTLTGTGFTGATAVNLTTNGGASLPVASFTVVNDTTLTIITPLASGAGGTSFNPQITTPAGTSARNLSSVALLVYVDPPAALSVTPNSGPLAGGNTVAVSGQGLFDGQGNGNIAVSFGSIAATNVTQVSGGTFSATVPAGTRSGAVDVSVTAIGGTTTLTGGYTYTYTAPKPTVTAVSTFLYSTGGQTITVTGTNFTGATSIIINNTPVTNFADVNDTTISAVTPTTWASGTLPHGAGNSLTVTTSGGTSDPYDFFYFKYPPATITSVTPNHGPQAGGTAFKIIGTNLQFPGVQIGGQAATFTVVSSTEIDAVTPAGSGTQDVVLTNPDYADTILTNGFTYDALPAITSISPNKLTNDGGQSITITGTGFTGATGLSIYSTPATFTVVNDTTIDATVPVWTHDNRPEGFRAVTVTGPTGTSNVQTIQFVYPIPVIASITPNHGPQAGGTTVKIVGTNMYALQEISIDGKYSIFSSRTPTEIDVVTPVGNAAGPVDVMLTTQDQQRSTITGGFTYDGAPVVTSISPSSGPIAGGNAVTITGTGFSTSSTSVKFGTNSPSTIRIVSDTSLIAIAPAGTGTVDITVATPSSTSAKSTADNYTYTGVAVPTVTSLSPNHGNATGGTAVKITGSGFDKTDIVQLSSGLAGGASSTQHLTFTFVSPTEIDVVIPAGTVGTTVGLYVLEPTTARGGHANFTYDTPALPVVSSLAPNHGNAAGGNTVKVIGSNFDPADVVQLAVNRGTGAGAGTNIAFTYVSSTEIDVKIPAGTAGMTASISVLQPVTRTGGHITYTYDAVPTPTVTSLSPNHGSSLGGNTVKIIGTNFDPADIVRGSLPIGNGVGIGINLKFTYVSPTEIDVVAPPGIAGVTFTVSVLQPVTNAGGRTSYTYDAVAVPVVTSLSPNHGAPAGGNTVKITGTKFDPADQLLIFASRGNGAGTARVLSFKYVSATEIDFVMPAGTAGSTATVYVARPVTAQGGHVVYTYDEAAAR